MSWVELVTQKKKEKKEKGICPNITQSNSKTIFETIISFLSLTTSLFIIIIYIYF